MFGSRRLAKRSIKGTRVCAAWQDGRYYPGVIQSVQEGLATETLYTILFDDGYTMVMNEREIIGPGFQSISICKLKNGQRVYVTKSGREVAGVVIEHNLNTEIVTMQEINLTSDQIESILERKLDEVRLFPCRKSARLQDQDTDYSRLADMPHGSEAKKRTVSTYIDVPTVKLSRRRKYEEDENEVLSVDDEGPNDDVECMDETMAAMVLTSLSCSPASPKFGYGFCREKGGGSPSGQSSGGSSGVYEVKSEPGTPLSHSAPPASGFILDEGIDLEDASSHCPDEGKAKRKRPSTRTVFQCTWPGCASVMSTCSGIERHVRGEHLERDSDCELSDHEEEFYYSEIETNVDNVTQSFAGLYSGEQRLMDHDYQKKSLPLVVADRGWRVDDTIHSTSLPSAVGHHPLADSRPLLMSSPGPKKCRSEVKKCRKVYGMDNRDMWCTQCKWKKACTRFIIVFYVCPEMFTCIL